MTTLAPEIKEIIPATRLTRDEALKLYQTADLFTLGIMAEEVKRRFHGTERPYTFVIDRNVNYTNVCNVDCMFCAFYRPAGHPEAYTLSYEQIKEKVDEMIAKIGENIIISDLRIFDTSENKSSYYVHNSYRKNIGKIISFLKYSSNSDDESIKNFAKNLCMHIAALKPEALDVNSLDQKTVDKELNIQKELILNSGKPANVIDKILEGKMKKFYSEVTLLNQSFVLNPEKSVGDTITTDYKGANFEIKTFNFISLT